MRRGVWQCPQCGINQVWKAKTRTERLDRSCEQCGKRVRAKLDRSSSGQGRRRSVRIWERGPSVSDAELQQEAERRNSALDLDTKWLVFDHEGVLYNSRFLLAGKDTLSLNGRQIPCNHFRMDIRISTDESPFYDETDRLMHYAVNENTVRQIWVEQNGIRRIIQANITANGFPFEFVIQND